MAVRLCSWPVTLHLDYGQYKPRKIGPDKQCGTTSDLRIIQQGSLFKEPKFRVRLKRNTFAKSERNHVPY